MHRPVVARSHALVSLLATSACVLPAPLGGNDTGTGTDGGTGGSTDGPGATSTATATAGDETGIDTGPAPAGPSKIDILFVMDNSGSMGEEQAALAASIDGLVDGLEAVEGISYRIGVTTTDMGNPWCGSTGSEVGRLVAESCRDRLGEFVFNGNPPADVADVACSDICTLDDLAIAPTPVAGDPTPVSRPWIEGGNGVTNLEGVGVGDALRCMLPQGIAGCGFEQPLKAVSRAIERSQTPGDANFGFLRDDAHLAIILVSDETDCSYADELIFLAPEYGGTREFWTDPNETAPTSGVCWNAGVVCGGEGSPYESCRAANYSFDGESDVPDTESVLIPAQVYVDQLEALLAQKRAVSDASVFLYGVMGVPVGYPANPLVFADAEDPIAQSDFGIGPGCVGEAGSATPPVRQLAVIESFAYDNLAGPQVFSICDPDLGGVYGQLVAQLAPYLGG